jgi:co-chaperonin GroES (HSP10)
VESKYSRQFSNAAEAGGLDGLRGDRLIVEVLPKEELVSKGGLVIASDMKHIRSDTTENRPTLAVVLAAGSGYVDEEGSDVPLDIAVGSVILVSALGLKLFSEFPGITDFVTNTIALTREGEVHISWPSIDAYLEYKRTINQ